MALPITKREPLDAQLTVALTSSMKVYLESLAQSNGVTTADIVRYIFDDFRAAAEARNERP